MASQWLIPASALACVGIFGATVGWTRHASPAFATRLLITLSAAVAAALAATLMMLALPLIGRSDSLADHGHWSNAVFVRSPASGLVPGVLAAAALLALVSRVVFELYRQLRDRAAAVRLRRELGTDYGETVVAAVDEVDAFALSSGVIVMTHGLATALGPDERRAVLAHERAHLDHRHHRYRRTAALLAAANPLLYRVPAATAYLTERWADEEAARATSRATTATALREVARLGGRRVEQSLATAHSAAVCVPERVHALESAPLQLRWYRLMSSAALVSCAIAIALLASERTLDLFQLARALSTVGR